MSKTSNHRRNHATCLLKSCAVRLWQSWEKIRWLTVGSIQIQYPGRQVSCETAPSAEASQEGGHNDSSLIIWFAQALVKKGMMTDYICIEFEHI